MNPDDPVPPLPKLKPRQRVRVIDAKSRPALARWDGAEGSVYGVGFERGVPLRFWPKGDHRTFPIDSPRWPGVPDALIVEPIES